MIVTFPNGAGVESSVIASIHVEASRVTGRDGLQYPPRIHVYTMRAAGGFSLLGSGRPSAEHFMSIQMPSDLEAENECRRLVAKWAGLPEPVVIEPTSVSGSHG